MAQQTQARSRKYGNPRRFECLHLGLLLAGALFFPCLTAIAQERADSSRVRHDVRALELGNPIERELKGGEVHTYQIKLTAGQYLHVVVDQRGIDVVVTLFGPDGKQLVEVDSPNGTQGPELVSAVAKVAGIFRLEVHSLEKDATPGRYEVRIEELRTATPQDSIRITAEKAFAEAQQLREQQSVGALRKAIEKYEEALPYWQNMGDNYKQAQTYNNLGGIYYFLGEYQKALGYYNQALPFIRAANDPNGEGRTLCNIGLVCDAFGEKQKAIESYTQALRLIRAVNDHYAEATTLSNLGLLYYSLGEQQKALEHHFAALPIRRALKDSVGEAVTLNGIGAVYTALGDNQKGFEYFTRALELRRTTRDRAGEATTLNNIGHIYDNQGEYQKALDYYNQALQLWQAAGDRDGEATALNNIGMDYLSLGEKQKALEYLRQALLKNRAVGNRKREAVALHNLGTIYAALNDKEQAFEHYEQALALRLVVEDGYGQAESYYGMARIECDRGNFGIAHDKMVSSLAIIDSLRTKVVGQELRASFFASLQQHFEFYIDLLMQLHQLHPFEGYDVAALQASERARARTLLETLGESHVDIRQGVDSVLVKRERVLQQQLNTKAERLTRLLSGKHAEEGAAAKKELDALLTEYQEVQAQIRATSPRYAALTQPQPLNVKEIQKQVLDDDTILLEYALGEKRSFLWALTPTTINSFELPKRVAIDSLARRVYELLTARNQSLPNETKEQKQARCAQADHELSLAAATLSQWVLGPVAGLLGDKRLLIVSDDALQYIPFGALPVPDSLLSVARGQSSESTITKLQATDYRPLTIDHEIVSIPSASVLAVLRRELAARQPAGKTVAVLADPVFTNDDPRVKHGKNKVAQQAKADSTLLADVPALASPFLRSVREMGATNSNESLSRLFFSRREAEGILQLVPAEEGMKAVDFAANRAIATSAELSRYRMVHFATHGLLNSAHPELSGIVLSLVDEQGKPQDGFLRLHEIYNLNLPADLVVLSACQTALGKEIRGEGLVGLTRGFMYAGAARVAASLWKVDDRATAELMRRFYEGMLGEKRLRPAAALRAAQISLWKETRWQSPYYWAAFVLQGEWR